MRPRALGLGVAHPEEADLAGAQEQLAREARVGIQVFGLRRDLAVGEGAEGVADGPLLVGDVEVHDPPSSPSGD